jgi:hypothetical protein
MDEHQFDWQALYSFERAARIELSNKIVEYIEWCRSCSENLDGHDELFMDEGNIASRAYRACGEEAERRLDHHHPYL